MKRWKNLGLLTFALIFLVIATILTRDITLEPETTEDDEDKSIVLASLDSTTITSLRWEYNGQEVVLRKDADSWVYADDESFPLNTAKAESLAAALASVIAEKVIENPEELSQYGLDAPVCRISVNSETEISFDISDLTSMDGYDYLSNGDGKVYLVSSDLLTNFSCGLYDLVQKESIPSMKDLISMSVISEVQNYEIAHMEESGIAYTDEYEWFLKDGDGWLTLDNSSASGFANKIRYLNWQSCENYHADDEAIASYGLDSPAASVEMRYLQSSEVATNLTADDGEPIYETVEEEKTFVLELGDYTDSCCYARISGSSMVYCIDASVLDDLLYMSYDDLRPDDVLLLDFTELLGAEVTIDGETFVFTKVSRTTEENGESTMETVWLLDEKETDIETVLRELTNLTSTGFADNERPKRTAAISFVFERANALHPSTELVIYPYDSTYSLVTLDGESTVFISRFDEEEIRTVIEDLIKISSDDSETE